MNDEQLTAEVKALEIRLTDLWGWKDLERIGHNLNMARNAMEPGNLDILADIRELELQLETHLSTGYGRALEDIDSTLKALPPGPVLTATLERLQRSLRLMGERSFAEFLDRVPQPDYDFFDNVGRSRPQAEVEREYDQHVTLTREAWQRVEKDLSDYIARVADYIGTTAAIELSPSPSAKIRTQWIGSASELAFLLTELVEAGHLVPPPIGKKTGKDGNRAAIADAILNAFDIRKKNGDPVSPTYFRSLMRPDSPDRGSFTQLFTIRPRTGSK